MSIAVKLSVPLVIDGVAFDLYHYDAMADVLYLHVDGAPETVEWGGTVEGHGVRFAADGTVIHATLVNAQWLLERDGTLNVTVRDDGFTARLRPDVIEPLLVETLRYA